MYYESRANKTTCCGLCPHGCEIPDGRSGICGVRVNSGGRLYAESYGRVSSAALDPIEKKPLRRFFPGSMILSVGSYGCNFHCPFCQNHEISVITERGKADAVFVSPEELCRKAAELVPRGNIGLAYTYNEPFISYEYVLRCAELCHAAGLKNVAVTNGFINIEPLLGVLPRMDALNIDLKAFEPDFYADIGGRLESVKEVVATAAEHCHVEVTTLIIPGKNDGEDEMERLSGWLSGVGGDIPLHITRFYPRYKLSGTPAASVERLTALKAVAARRLRYVF